MKRAEPLIHVVVRMAQVGVGISFLVLIVSVLVQVVGRWSGTSAVWTEELTRFSLLYMVAFGAGLALRSGDLVNVDIVCEMLPKRVSWFLRLFAGMATTVMALYLLLQTGKFVSIGKMQTSPALGLKMSWIHFSIWLMMALLALFGLLRIIGMLTGAEDGKPKQTEQLSSQE